MNDIGNKYRFVMESTDHIVMMVRIIDFDISCNSGKKRVIVFFFNIFMHKSLNVYWM